MRNRTEFFDSTVKKNPFWPIYLYNNDNIMLKFWKIIKYYTVASFSCVKKLILKFFRNLKKIEYQNRNLKKNIRQRCPNIFFIIFQNFSAILSLLYK